MCVWSAYTGKNTAAPILRESLKKIEGIWGGYYTGLATSCNGRLHCRKLIGNTRVWDEKFSLSECPGTCGIIHSRTNSGGDERWGHPFVGSSGKAAIIAQGSPGIFKDRANALFEEWGNELVKCGKVFSSSIYDLPKRYPVLADSGQIHSTEVAVQAMEYWCEKLGDPFEAAKYVFSRLPIEAAACLIFADHPGVIVFANVNQHMVYQQTEEGVFLSITALGLPGNCGMELPCNSVGVITPDGIRFERLHERYDTPMEMPPQVLSAVLEFITANPGKLLGNVTDAVIRPLFPADTLNYRVGIAYRCLETLVLDGKVHMEIAETESLLGTPGTAFYLYPNSK